MKVPCSLAVESSPTHTSKSSGFSTHFFSCGSPEVQFASAQGKMHGLLFAWSEGDAIKAFQLPLGKRSTVSPLMNVELHNLVARHVAGVLNFHRHSECFPEFHRPPAKH